MSLNLLPTTVSSTPMNGAFDYDVLTQVIYYSDVAATADFQLNFRGDSETTLASIVPVGQTIQTVLFVENGEIPRSLTNITIDGTEPTLISWLSNLPSSGSANLVAQYPINIVHKSMGVFLVY